MIINMFTIAGGVWRRKEGWVEEVRCVAGIVPALLQSGVRDTSFLG